MKLHSIKKAKRYNTKQLTQAFFISFLFTVFSYSSKSQSIVNAYAKVTAVNGSRTVLTLSNVDQTNHTFSVGSKVVVMQMQANVIGSDTSDNSSFGTLSNIGNAGRYEFATISSLTPSSGTPTSITLTTSLYYTYTTDANSSVQIVSFRNFGANYTTTSNITGLAWNGNIGGVIAIEVDNTFTLNHNISVDGLGFRGGNRSTDFNGPVCVAGNATSFKSNSSSLGAKGEGIYRYVSPNFQYSRGKLVNGGGGGGHHNAGGGGGGNYSSGGNGGNGYNNCTTFPGGGQGGLGLSSQISFNRLFMGGGGGGGQQNNSLGSSGGNGGGMILIKANTLLTNTVCSGGITISANGNSAAAVGNDGAGGGGAAGSIIIQVTTFSASSTCPLLVRANGGSGGSGNNGSPHAGGGGGSQGVVIYSATQPTTNVTTSAANGSAGVDGSGGNVSATIPPAPNNSGIDDEAPTTLPIELLNFKARYNKESKQVKIEWTTASQTNNDFFSIEKSTNTLDWELITDVDGAGTNSSTLTYSVVDPNPNKGFNYYRLKQTDFDGNFEYFPIQKVNMDGNDNLSISIAPNPSKGFIKISSYGFKFDDIEILDYLGKPVSVSKLDSPTYEIELDLSNLTPGMYVAKIRTELSYLSKKIIIKTND